jgi:hypothetical protein
MALPPVYLGTDYSFLTMVAYRLLRESTRVELWFAFSVISRFCQRGING